MTPRPTPRSVSFPSWSKRTNSLHRSLSTRYLAVVGSIIVACELILGLWQVQARYERRRTNLEAQVRSKAEFLSAVTPEAIADRDLRALDTLMRQATLEPEIVYALALDERSRVLTRDLDRSHPAVRRTLADDSSLTSVLDTVRAVRQQPNLRTIVVSVRRDGNTIGEIWLGYSIATLELERRQGIANTVALSLAIALILSGVTVVLFARRVRRPLQELADLARAVASGDLDRRPDDNRPPRQDEIGQLQQAFDRMTERLQRRSQERDRAEATLHASESAVRRLYRVASDPHLTCDERLQALFEMGRQYFHMEAGMLTQVQGVTLNLVATQDPQGAFALHVGSCYTYRHSLCKYVLHQDEVLAIHDVEQAEVDLDFAQFSDDGVRAYLGAPVYVNDQTDGVLCFLGRTPRTTPFHARDRQLLELMAQWLGNELERQRARTALEQQFQRALLLDRITRKVRQSLDTQAIVQTAIDEIGSALAVDRGIIHAYLEGDPPQIPIVAQYLKGDYPVVETDIVPVSNNPHVKALFESQRAIATPDVYAEPLLMWAHQICCDLEIQSMLAVRTSYQDKPNGIIGLHQCDRYRHWTADEIELLEAVADRVGIALAQAQLLERETEQRQQLAERNQALDAARQAAEAANRAKSEFLAIMSHEIRTPLNGSLTAIELLQDTDLSARQQHLANTAERSGQELLAIVQDILDFSELDSQPQAPDEQPFSPTVWLDRLLDAFAPQANAKGLTLRSQLAAGVPERLLADPSRWQRIARTLLGNAIKFTEQGDIELRIWVNEAVELLDTDPNGARLWIGFAISDTGIGLSPNTQSRLFQPFSPGDTSVTRPYGGTGLGLALAQRLVQRSGGTMWADSGGKLFGETPPGVTVASTPESGGTTFYFTLPATLPSSPEGTAIAGLREPYTRILEPSPRSMAASASRADVSPPLLPENLRLLLAEDHAVNQEVIQLLLDKLGLHADLANNGREVLQRLQRQNYDAILMDVEMPQLDGISTTREIHRRYPADSRPRIIALTAYAMSGDRERCLVEGMDDYLTKPIQREALVRALQRVVPRGDAPVLDRRVLDDIRQMAGDRAPAFLTQLVQTYFDEAVPRLAALQSAIDRDDPEALAKTAHALRSSSANLGALSLSSRCRTLERLGRDGSTVGASEQLASLEREYDRLRAALQAECF